MDYVPMAACDVSTGWRLLWVRGRLSQPPYRTRYLSQSSGRDRCHAAGRRGSAIVVPTNTSSFGTRSGAAEQELQLSQMRAAELGLWLVQAAPSGISAFIDPAGKVTSQVGSYRAAVLRGEIRLGISSTPFSRWGETPEMLLAAVLVALGAWPSVRRRRRLRT